MQVARRAALGFTLVAVPFALAVFSQGAGAATNIPAGALAANATWDGAGSPYNLSGSVTVPAGITLQIRQGASVELASGAFLVIAGRLDAVGSTLQPIAFRPAPPATWWGAVQVAGSGRARIENASLAATDQGVWDQSAGAVDLANLRIESYSRTSIFLDGATGFVNASNISISGGSWGLRALSSSGAARFQGVRIDAVSLCLEIEQSSNLTLQDVNASNCFAHGFDITGSTEIVATNVSVRATASAVNVTGSSRVRLSDLNVESPQFCVHIRNGAENTVSGLRAASCALALVVEGTERNLVAERINLTSGARILLFGGSNLTLRDSTLSGAAMDGVSNRWVIPPPPPAPPAPPEPAQVLWGTPTGVVISNVTVDNRQWGFVFEGLSGLTLRKVTVPRASNGALTLRSADNVTVNASKFVATLDAVFAETVTGLTVEDSTMISVVGTGVLCTPCTGAMIRGNVFTSSHLGVRLSMGTGGVVTRNLFLYNTVHASTNSGAHLWDDGAIGNLWDDYTGVDADLNGIGDTPYPVPGNLAQDRYPIARYPDNEAPTADAGPDFVVFEDTQVWFNGWRASDNLGIRLYLWSSLNALGAFTVEGYDAMMVFDTPGVYTVTLTVIDFGGNRGQDTVDVFVLDRTRPVASAGGNRTVDEDVVVLFDGSGSTDNDPAFPASGSFEWTVSETKGPRVVRGLAAPYTFEDPGNFTVTLVVRDGAGLSDLQRFFVEVRDRTPPSLGALTAPVGEEDAPFRAYAAPSTDNDPWWPIGKSEWFELFRGGALLDNTTASPAVFNVSEPGVYAYWYSVSDAAGNVARADVNFVVGDATAPNLTAIGDRTAELGEPTLFDLTGVTDNDPTFPATAVAFWEVPVPAGKVVLPGASATFTFTKVGRYFLWAQVADRAGNVARQPFLVTVVDTHAPTLEVFGPAALEAGESARYWANATDPSGVRELVWHVTGLAEGREGSALTYRFMAPGSYTVRVEVEDPLGHGAEAELLVSVVDATLPRVAVACGPSGACEGLNVFVGESLTAAFVGGDEVKGLGVRWNWSDGSFSEGPLATHAFARPGTYLVTVQVFDAASNLRALSFNVTASEREGPTLPPPTGNVTDTQGTGAAFPVVAAIGLAGVVAAVGLVVGFRLGKARRPAEKPKR